MFRNFLYVGLLILGGCTTLPPKILQNVAAEQAIVVHSVSQGSFQASLSTWRKKEGHWQRVRQMSAVIGRNGLAATGDKKEGDGKTPSGIYPLESAFGYASSVETGLSYRQATDHDFWVDDAQSLQYNQWVTGSPEARSFERMKRPDNLYQYGVIIGYNKHPVVPGAGSAIFMHVWRNSRHPTAGCVALNQRNLRKLLRWLDSQFQPVIVLE